MEAAGMRNQAWQKRSSLVSDMATQLWAVLLVLFGSIISSFGPIFLKKGSQKVTNDLKSFIFNKYIFIGLCFYGFGTIIFIPALKGGDLSVIYPLVSVAYIWVALYSMWLLKEKMNLFKWIGIAFIIFGVSLIGLGSM
jgi:uncharacterized membrane protein